LNFIIGPHKKGLNCNFGLEEGSFVMELEKTYDPRKVEEKWYKYWEENNLFHSEKDEAKKPFTIVIPPPNVTGILHMGHGLNNTLQDIIIRWKRMQGFNALWLPGTDHAGIATQNVVEKQLSKEGKSRHKIGREAFIEMVWKWREKYGSTIIKQLRNFGASCDWRRERFTMDEGLSRAVREVFVRLYDEGLIYKGKYIINWCPRCQTALSDEEVEHEAESGNLYYILYPFKDEEGGLTVATTRPETMLGDTAVAVNPRDERYSGHIGKTVILPLTDRELTVIGDGYVDTEFGTGALKITPAHDPNDFEIGVKHGLERINIFNIDATVNENGIPECVGMDRYECRDAVLEKLKSTGALIKQEPYSHEIGHCYRCHTVIEPYLSEQWFVRMKPLAVPAIEAVEKGETVFYPARWEKVYMNWMNGIRDWCISRQIWWGHRIPVYYCDDCEKEFASVDEPERCAACDSPSIRQDEDVLDTWFSSQLWPFSTLGWPDDTEDLDYYYPTSVLVTDPGILFFWVARMIMSGLKFMNRVPFKDVYIHGVVMDEKGRKMSKSLGNGIDPLEVVEKFGADAMRYTIVNITPIGQNLLLSMDKFNIGSRFANKIWNASRYILMNIDSAAIDGKKPDIMTQDTPDPKELDTADRWILTMFEETVKKVTRSLGDYRFNDASSLIYEFFWHEYCDWYIEISKVKLYGEDEGARARAAGMLLRILEGSMRLLHPIMPFITEEVWQLIHRGDETGGKSIMISTYPVYNKKNIYAESKERMELLKEINYNIRNIRGEMNVPAELKAAALVKTGNEQIRDVIEENRDVIMFLSKLKEITSGPGLEKPEKSAFAAGNGYEVYLPLTGLIDFDREKLRLSKELVKLEGEISRCSNKLANSQFISRAPEAVVEKEKEKLETVKKNHSRISVILKTLE
jgi:valyl-tRNA synthetase